MHMRLLTAPNLKQSPRIPLPLMHAKYVSLKLGIHSLFRQCILRARHFHYVPEAANLWPHKTLHSPQIRKHLTSDRRLAKIMYKLVLIAVSVCLLEKAVTVGAQTCYFPDGSVAGRDTPCRAPTSDQASACCAYSDICLDNNLCLGQNGSQSISRGSCTDQTWHSSECPQYCQDGKMPIFLCAVQDVSCLHTLF